MRPRLLDVRQTPALGSGSVSGVGKMISSHSPHGRHIGGPARTGLLPEPFPGGPRSANLAHEHCCGRRSFGYSANEARVGYYGNAGHGHP